MASRQQAGMRKVTENEAPTTVVWLLVAVYNLAKIQKGLVERLHQAGIEAEVGWYLDLNALIERLEREYEGLK